MNLSKKTIKHILRILEYKCEEVPTQATVFKGCSSGCVRVESRDFVPCLNWNSWYGWQRIIYVPVEGYFYGIKIPKRTDEGIEMPDILSPAQLADL